MPEDDSNFLAASEDSEITSIMSYVKAPQQQERVGLGPYDLLALQYLYGSRPVNPGNSTYAFTDADGRNLQMILDTGGTNVIDLSAVTAPATLNLTPGASSSVGIRGDGVGAVQNVQIAFGTVIQSAIGTAGADTITGNDAANTLTGGAGNDTIAGGAGIDTAVYTGNRAAYTIAAGSASTTVADSVATRDGRDTLSGVERLRFADGSVALDVTGNAGIAAKVLGVVFGSAAATNPAFLGLGMYFVDNLNYGMSQMMNLALGAALGPAPTSTQVVNLIFTNLVGAAPDPATRASLTSLIDGGAFTNVSFGVAVAELKFNQIRVGLVGATSGLAYQPYVG